MNPLLIDSKSTAEDEGFKTAGSRSDFDEPADTRRLAFEVELQSLSSLVTVLSALAALGADLLYVRALERTACIVLNIPRHLAHRVQGRLGQIIEIITVSEITHWKESCLKQNNP